MIGVLTVAMFSIAAAFAALDVTAWVTHGRYGTTFSTATRNWMRSLPRGAREFVWLLVIVFGLSLGPHLAWGTPILP